MKNSYVLTLMKLTTEKNFLCMILTLEQTSWCLLILCFLRPNIFHWSISPTFYERLLRQYINFGKKLQTQILSTEKLQKLFRTKKLHVKCWWSWHKGSILRFTSSFYKWRSQKHKKTLMAWLDCIFALLISSLVKTLHKHVDEIDSRRQFYQGSMSSFYTSRSRKCPKDSKIASLFCAFGICVHKSCS